MARVTPLPPGDPCQTLFDRIDEHIRAVDIDTVEDPDVQRNRDRMRAAGLCLGIHAFKEHGRHWTVQYLFNPAKQPGPVWAVPHDNEDTAFDSAVTLVGRHGGGAVMIEAGEQRVHAGQDPNHVFARTRKQARRCRLTQNPHPRLIEAFMAGFKAGRPERLFLSLHANDDGFVLNGGKGTISVHRTTLNLQPYPATKPVTAFADEDDLIILSKPGRRKLDKDTRRRIAKLNEMGVNVVLEKVAKWKGDCSLSHYVTQNNLGDYYNVEVQHGHGQTQIGLAESLLRALGFRAQADSVADNFIIPGGG